MKFITYLCYLMFGCSSFKMNCANDRAASAVPRLSLIYIPPPFHIFGSTVLSQGSDDLRWVSAVFCVCVCVCTPL